MSTTTEDPVYLLDSDMNPLHGRSGSLVWERRDAEAMIGQTPETGYGYPAHSIMAASAYRLTWCSRFGQSARWHCFPRETTTT